MEENAIRDLVEKIIAPFIARIEILEKKSEDSRVWQAKYGTYIEEVRDIVKGLQSKPEKRWETVIVALITAAVTATVTILLK